MASATNSRTRKHEPVGDVAALVRRIADVEVCAPIPLLVVRVRDLERLAWRQGRAAARSLERRSLRAFVATATRVLRASDVLAHDDESEDFLVALISPTRSPGSVATPTDCRATLARLASAMESSGEMRVETGWTVLHGVGNDRDLARAVESALERGARERERYDFFSTLGHELRTPLTSIRGYLETLIEGDLDPTTAQKFLEVARAEAERMGRLVDGMFDLSMLDLRADAARLESSELGPGIVTAIDAIAPVAAMRGTRIALLSEKRHQIAIGADRLVQILVNVFDNAVKHGRDAGRVEISYVELDGRYLEIRIDDDGPGVLPEEREAIFALAKRGARVVAKGSGIGLAIVRLMIERVGGEVDVTQSPLGGARFRLRVPLFAVAGPSVEASL
jgi:signal transduction histidine kinase